MPELPDVVVYVEALTRLLAGERLEAVDLRSPFLLRTAEVGLDELSGLRVVGIHRQGKRIVWQLDEDFWLVFHLMIAGRFHWKRPGVRPTRKVDLAAFQFAAGSLLLTEASPKKRASLHILRGSAGLAEHARPGLEVLDADVSEFESHLRRENRTLKRALTDPRIFSGIGNAYSDEILHAARLSPFLRTSQLSQQQVAALHAATQSVLRQWVERLRAESGDRFPERVTAFRSEMAVHGRYGQPCPDCGTPVQRVIYADNEMNYCPRCQTEGRLLADRSLSRLLKDDWPRSLEELELMDESRKTSERNRE